MSPLATDSAKRLDLAAWRIPITLLITLIVVTWTWITQRGGKPTFPPEILPAEGLLLAALVFSLGFAQQGLRRALVEALEEARTRGSAVLDSYLDDPPGISSMDVFEAASRLAMDADKAASLTRSPRWELAVIARRYRHLPQIRQERFNEMFALSAYAWIAERREGESEKTHRRRLAKLKKGRPRLEASLKRKDEFFRSMSKHSGELGHDVVVGRMKIGAGAAYSAWGFASVFILAMSGLFFLGVAQVGWTKTLLSDVQFWVALTPIALALAYAGLVGTELRIELARFAGQIYLLPLVQLFRTEQFIKMRSTTAKQDVNADSMEDLWASEVCWRLDRLDMEVPGLLWTSSIRGRMHLALALSGDRDDLGSLRRRGDLRRAESYLRRGSEREDEPVSLVAFTRCLEEISSPRETDLPKEAEEALHAATRVIVHWQEMASESAPANLRDNLISPAHQSEWDRVRDALGSQQWFWPRHPTLRRELEHALEH